MTLDSPAGGMGQFKGLSYGTTEKKYVQTICLGIQPMYYLTYALSIDDTTGVSGNGWVVSCYTGIPQCEVDQVLGVAALTATETTSCMDDPRYMTWRVMTLKMDYTGAVSWYRTDSYWNASSTMFSSTWGVGVRLSTNIVSEVDNNGSTVALNMGKTFVFAYGDGSGIQLNHIAFGTTPPSGNATAGSGTNTLTTAPTTFSNTSPLMVSQ